MSYAIIRIQKMTTGTVKGIQIHDQREKEYSHTNSDIDFSKSHLNEDLQNKEKVNFNHKVKERIQELQLPKAVRKDAIVMCQCLVTSDKAFFEKMPLQEQKRFFEDSFKFIKERYGEKNMVSATVHYDEKTPHMHVNFVPVTQDGRLCAKDLFKRADLSKLHDDFHKHCKEHGYDLERGESKGEIKKHLSVEEYKIETKKQELDKTKTQLDRTLNKLQSEKEALKDTTSNLYDLEHLEAKKSLIGAKITLSEKDFNKLLDMAKKGIHNSRELSDLKREVNWMKDNTDSYRRVNNNNESKILELRQENQKLKGGLKDLKEQGKAMYETLKKHDLIPEAQDYLQNMREAEKVAKKVLKKSMDLGMER